MLDPDLKFDLKPVQPSPDKPVVVVRIKTSYWSDGRGIHTRRDMIFLLRKCRGYNFVAEDAAAVGADEVIPRITNFDSVEDGVYEVITVAEERDRESGYIEDWDYQLVPYEYK